MSPLDKKLDKIEKTCDEIKNEISNIHVVLAVNTGSLKDHMRRTQINEDAIHEILSVRLPPIVSMKEKILFIIKVIPWALGIAGSILAIIYKTGFSFF